MAQALLAAGGDWLQFIIPIVFFIIYAINHLISSGKGKQQQRPNVPRRKTGGEAPQQRAEPAGAKPSRGQAQLNAEIEQFLKRADQRKGQQKQRREPSFSRPPEPAASKPAPPVPAPPLEPERPRPLGTVATSVEQHLGNRGFNQRAEHLADDIVRADQQMEERLKKSFGHRLGTLGTTEPVAGALPVTDVAPQPDLEPTTSAALMARLLADPQNIRQAIILGEILQRPEHRW